MSEPMTIQSVSDAHVDYRRRIGGFVLNRLHEVTNKYGGCIGYTLPLNQDETEKLIKLIEGTP